MRDDPLLKQEKSVSSEGLEYTFVGLSSSCINTVDACINLVWVMANSGKVVRPKEIIENTQQIFKSEEVKSKDVYWKEHCAGSLRELVDSHFEQNCKRFLKCTPERAASEEERGICEKLKKFKDFLNDFAHFKDTALSYARELLGDQGITEVNEQSFDKLCTGFILQIEVFFKCKKL